MRSRMTPCVTTKAEQALEKINAERQLTGEGPTIAWLARTLRVSRSRARTLVEQLARAGRLVSAHGRLTPVP